MKISIILVAIILVKCMYFKPYNIHCISFQKVSLVSVLLPIAAYKFLIIKVLVHGHKLCHCQGKLLLRQTANN